MTKETKKYKYLYLDEYGSPSDLYDNIKDLLDTIFNDGYAQEDLKSFTFLRAEEGQYVPPSSPATIIFP